MNKYLLHSTLLLLSLPILVSVGCDSKNVGYPPESTKSSEAALPEPPAIPFEIKGFKLGMKYEEAKKLLARAFTADNERYNKRFVLHSTIAGNKCDIFPYFEDYGEGLILVTLTINTKKYGYRDIKAAIIEKYGNPIKEDLITKHNAMGASYNGEEAIWQNKISKIDLEEIGYNIDECRLYMAYIDPQGRKSLYVINNEKKKKKDI